MHEIRLFGFLSRGLIPFDKLRQMFKSPDHRTFAQWAFRFGAGGNKLLSHPSLAFVAFASPDLNRLKFRLRVFEVWQQMTPPTHYHTL